MLTKFAVKNYRGFADRIEWDLSHPSNYTFNQYAIKDGIVKNGIMYGPNGSGKTNLSLALFDVVNHLTQKFKKFDYYKNFIFAGKKDGLVEFEYTFNLDGTLLQYDYSKVGDGKLINEYLVVNGKTVFSHKGRQLEIDTENFPMEEGFKKNLAENANNVSIVNVLLTSYPLASNHYLLKLKKFVEGMLWFRNLDVREFIGLETNVYLLDEFIIRKGLVDDFASFLKTVSGQEFKFAAHVKTDKKLLCRYGKETVPFDVIASTGTCALKLLYFWIQRMGEASFVFIDEFDAFYHFELSYQVCKRLFALDCQVFTSSHNTYLMTNDLLRPDCNFILDKNQVKALCDLTDKELRLGHNIEKLYRGKSFQL
ncbi:MAG: AAA family ATPase [Bacteroidales bacterium]|nr:AAA family ATPase [Bacteroidales bacterium]